MPKAQGNPASLPKAFLGLMTLTTESMGEALDF
jgi:hypothetical protein